MLVIVLVPIDEAANTTLAVNGTSISKITHSGTDFRRNTVAVIYWTSFLLAFPFPFFPAFASLTLIYPPFGLTHLFPDTVDA
jgi:hypothetical protein